MEVIGLSETITISKRKVQLGVVIVAVLVVAMAANYLMSLGRGIPITDIEIGHIYQVVGIMEELNDDGSLEFKLADNTPKPKNYELPANKTFWISLGVNITMLDDGSIREVPPKGPLINHDS